MSADDERPLLLREDLKVAALRAASAAPVLLLWVHVEGVMRSGRGGPPLSLGLTLTAVVFACALVDLHAVHRAWPFLRTGLAVGLLGAVGAFAAGLQARVTGVDLLEGEQVARHLARMSLARLEQVVALPLTVGAGLALLSVAAHASRIRNDARAGVGPFAGAIVLGIALATLWRPDWTGFLIVVAPLCIAMTLAIDRRADAHDRRLLWSWPDAALAAGVVALLLLPSAGRVVHSIRRANALAAAERRLVDGLEAADAREALAHLDASIALRDAPRARLERARRRVALGLMREAEDDLEAAARVAARDDDEDARAIRLEAHAEWADLLATDYDRALTTVEKYTAVIDALEKEPELALEHGVILRRALAGRSAAHVTIQDDALAERDATKLLDAEFNSADAFLRRGVTRAIAGRLDEARADVARAAELGSAEARRWQAALWGEPAVTLDEHAVLEAATTAGQAELATTLALLGIEAERAGDATRAKLRYQSCLRACTNGSASTTARPSPGTHLGGLWAFRRLLAR